MADKNDLINTLSDWNFWDREQKTGVPRLEYVLKILKSLEQGQITIVTGVRRSGKSYLLRQTAAKLMEQGVPKINILLANFEDPRFLEKNTALLEKIFAVYKETFNPEGEIYLFLDEVQEVFEWEKWVQMTHELGKAKVVVTGSNSKLLSAELATLLTGRHQDITVYPLSFTEYLDFNPEESPTKLLNYLETGGFPDIVLGKGDKTTLLTYFEDIISEDLVHRFKIRQSEGLNSLARFYLSNPACQVSFGKVGRSLNLSTDSVIKFSGYLRTAFLNYFVNRFSWKVKEQEKSFKKVYCVDTGLAGTVGFFPEKNLGFLAENLVFLELKRRGAKDGEIFYWKGTDEKEVDFILKKENKLEAVQVCWDLSRPQTKEREVKSLLAAMGELNLDQGLILTGGETNQENFSGKTIEFISLAEWLLATEK